MLRVFQPTPTADGNTPAGPLILASDGALYGTASNGGTNNGWGTLFRLNTDGSGFQVLHTFSVFLNHDGVHPYGGLLQAVDGALYGTTWYGGAYSEGALYSINTNGTGYRLLHNFGAFAGDGNSPFAGLIQGSDGALYGTTSSGGSNNFGTVFRLNTDGSAYTNIYSFSGSGSPGNRLVQGSDGKLYGMASKGGTNGCGAVYRLRTDGSEYVELHSFGAGNDGRYSYAGLIQGKDGALYGTTFTGGTNNEAGGTVFKINPDGTGYTMLHGFDGGGADPHNPEAELVQGLDGALYGTTYNGGANGLGAVFRLSTNGTGYCVVYSFGRDVGDGACPDIPVIQGPDCTFYGMTGGGGTNNTGTLFRLVFSRPQLDSPMATPDGGFRFSLTAIQNFTYRIDVSTNLVSWTMLTNILSVAGTMDVKDGAARNLRARFYRAVWPP